MNDISLEVIVTKKSIENTFKDKFKDHYASIASDFLSKQGILPLTYSNPKLEILTALGFMTYSSGTLHSSPHYRAQLNCDISRFKKLFKEGLELEFAKPRKNDNPFGLNGVFYARVLCEMGFFSSKTDKTKGESTKAKEGSKIPYYATRLIDEYPEYNVASQNIAQKVLKSMLAAFCETKMKNGKKSFYLGLIGQPSKDAIYEQGIILVNAINLLYPEIELTKNDINHYASYDKFGGYIFASQSQMSRLPKDTEFPPKLFLQ